MLRRNHGFLAFVAFALMIALAVGKAHAQPAAAPPTAHLVEPSPIPRAAAEVPLDPLAATQAYLDSVPREARARSDAYFEGGYWLKLVDFLMGAAIGLLLLSTGASAKMRDFAVKRTRLRPLRAGLYWAMYLVAATVLGFPLSVYEGFVREHAYGLSNMTFGSWLGDQAKELLVGLVLGGLVVPILYAVLARAQRTWWIWGAVVTMAFLTFAAAIAPVYIAPVFNKYTPVSDERIRGPILAMARANGIEAKDVYEFDESRQSTRVSANVSGFGATLRISLTDNLLARCSLPEIEQVMGHEMGHYVLHHVEKLILQMGIVIVVGFFLMKLTFERLRARFTRWKVEGVADPAGLPLLFLLLSTYLFVMTPVMNTIIRSQEVEADLFGVNASRQPDGMAQVSLKLADYRKLDPGPLEELLFFDHPSGRNRILMAMRWKAEHVGDTPLPPLTPEAGGRTP